MQDLQDLAVFSGNANRPLALAICQHLGISLGDAEVFQFSNENIFVKIKEDIREKDVFLVQSFNSPVNTSIMELLIMIDACKRASARRITAVIPHYSYGRSDKKDQPRVPITARLLANMIEVAGANRVLTMDLHAGQIQGFFNVPVDELLAAYIQARYWIGRAIPNLTVVSVDEGYSKKARKFADLVNAPLAIAGKSRKGNNDEAEVMELVGVVQGRNVLIVDDEVDTAGSITGCMQLLKNEGALQVYAAATHAVLSGSAIARLETSPCVELTLTDTIPLRAEKHLSNMTILSVAEFFAQAILNIHSGASVSALFHL